MARKNHNGAKDDGTARTVAARLRALAEALDDEPLPDPRAAMMMNAFYAAARALESAGDPPPRHQLLALVQVLTAGFDRLLAAGTPDYAALAANDRA